jgi:hypothetical protein
MVDNWSIFALQKSNKQLSLFKHFGRQSFKPKLKFSCQTLAASIMTKNQLYKYSTLLTLLFSSGLLFFVVEQISDINNRYRIFDIFQIGTNQLFNLVNSKFKTDLSITKQFSYEHIGPLVNVLAGFLWTFILLFLFSFIKKSDNLNLKEQPTFWRKVFFTNLILSFLFFAIWFVFMDIDFINSGQYNASETSDSNLKNMYDYFLIIPFSPAIIPGLISTITLEKYETTTRGLYDSYLVSKNLTSFGLTIWAIIGVFIYTKIKGRRKSNIEKVNASS